MTNKMQPAEMACELEREADCYADGSETGELFRAAAEIVRNHVEVVRCGECVKQDMPDCPHNYIENHAMVFWDRPNDWYCAQAERKDDDENV